MTPIHREKRPRLMARYIKFSEARAVVGRLHRHLPKIIGAIICLACYDGDRQCGVLIVGRPVSRHLDDGETWEVNRCAHDGTPNAGSCLYGAAARLAKAAGMRLVTYTLPSESGASLRGAGWVCEGSAGGRQWSCDSRPRQAALVPEVKLRWRAA